MLVFDNEKKSSNALTTGETVNIRDTARGTEKAK